MQFTPINGGAGASVTLAATTTSAGGAIPQPTGALIGSHLLITNAGAEAAFVRFGVGAQTAVASDMPVRAGSSIIVQRGQATHVAAIVSGTSATVYVTTGTVE